MSIFYILLSEAIHPAGALLDCIGRYTAGTDTNWFPKSNYVDLPRDCWSCRSGTDRTKTRWTSGQRHMGTVPAGTDPMFSSQFLTVVVLARFYHWNHETLPVTGFGNGSRDLPSISESVFHRGEQLHVIWFLRQKYQKRFFNKIIYYNKPMKYFLILACINMI